MMGLSERRCSSKWGAWMCYRYGSNAGKAFSVRRDVLPVMSPAPDIKKYLVGIIQKVSSSALILSRTNKDSD